MITARSLWTSLPPHIRDAMLLGARGSGRLMDIIAAVVKSVETGWTGLPPQDVLECIKALAVAAWEESPFDRQACGLLMQLERQKPFLPEPLRRAAAQGARLPGDGEKLVKELEALYAPGRAEQMRSFLQRRLRRDNTSLFPLYFAVGAGLRAGERDWFEHYCKGMALPPLLLRLLDGDTRFAAGQWAGAAEAYQGAVDLCPLPGLLYKLAESKRRAGDGSLELFRRVSAQTPWDAGLILRLADMEAGLDRPAAPPQGQGVVLLYSWNHAGDLRDALQCLLDSDMGSARVLLLDNGSTDDTAAVAETMCRHFAGRMRRLRLPVNVGAPAARNWLLQEPEAAAADWVVYLDDDALVPPDWLGHLGTAENNFPQAGILGCQVVDVTDSLAVQSTDLHLECDLINGVEPGGAMVFSIADLCSQTMDFGQFNYLRPCLSVTGCCHLLKRADIEKTGGFDLLFSPSQFDDFERDLRAALAGEQAVYNGHLRVRHMKRSGRMSVVSRKQAANVEGNFTKLHSLYTDTQKQDLRENDFRQAFAYLLKKINTI